jgi:hypothetical protein
MQSKVVNNIKVWSVADFEKERPSLMGFVRDKFLPLLDDPSCKRIVVRAPVKSGKRQIVEYLAIRDRKENPSRVHVFVSAFHRVADEMQRDELGKHNLEVRSLSKKQDATACNNWISKMLKAGKNIVVHIDECDFGSGDKQVLCQVYQFVRNDVRITCVLYSATPAEVHFSGEVEYEECQNMMDDFEASSGGKSLEYEPPPEFCGPAKFLDHGLIKHAKPFFYSSNGHLSISNQGLDILNRLSISTSQGKGRNILVLRLSYSNGGSKVTNKANKAFHQFVNNCHSVKALSDFDIIVHSKDKKKVSGKVQYEDILWSDKEKYWDKKRKDKPIIMVIDQTSSRSTEWDCHDRVFAYHDFRNSITFNTVSQAQERVNHYEGKYGGFQPIEVYGHLKTFLLSAKRIKYSEYKNEWKLKKVQGKDQYRVVHVDNLDQDHPNCPQPVPFEEAEFILQDLGEYGKIEISERVSGSIEMKREIVVDFIPCNKDTFDNDAMPYIKDILSFYDNNVENKDHKFKNPFVNSQSKGLKNGRWKGYLRSWEVFDYDIDILPKPGWGMSDGVPRLTICYKNNILGVAVRCATGDYEEVNSLTTHSSMYRK